MIRLFTVFFFCSVFFACYSQEKDKDKDLIQFSGVVVEADSLKPLPFTKVMIKNSNRGTLADYYGYFSFVALKKDTIIFNSVGYKKTQYIIPDTLSGNKYSLIQVLRMDTLTLPVTTIYPWPTPEEFKKVFLTQNIPDGDYERAKKNLEKQDMQAKYETMPMDASMNYKGVQQQYQSKLYWAGQYPPNNLLNPFAWAQFVKMWREGKLKIKSPNEKKDKEEQDK